LKCLIVQNIEILM